MTRQVLIIEKSLNETPENKVNERIQAIAAGHDWRIVSATTSLAPVGETDLVQRGARYEKIARHVYYVTTVVLELLE